MLHERNTREKLQRLLQARGIADASSSTPSEQEEDLTLNFSKILADYERTKANYARYIQEYEQSDRQRVMISRAKTTAAAVIPHFWLPCVARTS